MSNTVRDAINRAFDRALRDMATEDALITEAAEVLAPYRDNDACDSEDDSDDSDDDGTINAMHGFEPLDCEILGTARLRSIIVGDDTGLGIVLRGMAESASRCLSDGDGPHEIERRIGKDMITMVVSRRKAGHVC